MGLLFRSSGTTMTDASTTASATATTAFDGATPAPNADSDRGETATPPAANPGGDPQKQGCGMGALVPNNKMGDLPHWTAEASADPVNGAELLNVITAVFERYLILPADAAETLALWAVHTYVVDAQEISPYLAVTSPTMQCGKTTLFTVLFWLAHRTEFVSNITAAAIFRYVDAMQPTLLIDEGETFLTENRELRGILNSGHTRAGAYIRRIWGSSLVRFSTWGAKAFALNGTLPGTLADRSITVPMRRKKSSEARPRCRDRDTQEFQSLRRQALRWANDNFNALADSDPKIPEALYNRAADNWRPLIAIADLAGGKWPEAARRAAVAITGTTEDNSTGTQLLRDLRWLFDGKPEAHDGKLRREHPPADKLFSHTIIDELNKIATSPWAGWGHGKGFTQRDLGKALKPYGAHPETVRIGTQMAKGYYRAKLTDAFERYLPSAANVTTSRTNENGHHSQELSVTQAADVTDERPQEPAFDGHCDAVTLQAQEAGSAENSGFPTGVQEAPAARPHRA